VLATAECPLSWDCNQACGPGWLFFSQYQDSAIGFNRYLQLYNPSNVTVSLDAYFLRVNPVYGSCYETLTSNFTVGASIGAKQTYLVCHSAMPGDQQACDEKTAFLAFGGDDVVVLAKRVGGSYAVADQIGSVSVPPTSILYAYGAANSNVCPAGFEPITTAADCETAAAESRTAAATAGIATTTRYGGVMPSNAAYPRGCFYYSTGIIMAVGVWFNPDPVGAARSSGQLICKRPFSPTPPTAGLAGWPVCAGTPASPGMTMTGRLLVRSQAAVNGNCGTDSEFRPDFVGTRVGACVRAAFASLERFGI
jgi:hypothetical protein